MANEVVLHTPEGPDEGYEQEKHQPVNAADRSEKTAVDLCGAKHPKSWWITCQLEPDHFGEHVRDCAPVEVGERLMFSQYTVHWQDPCECPHTTVVGWDSDGEHDIVAPPWENHHVPTGARWPE